MKKWWVLVIALCALMMYGSAGAERYFQCDACGQGWARAVDSGSYHRIECDACGYYVEGDHELWCDDTSRCGVCGNTKDLDGLVGVVHFIKGYEPYDTTYHLEWCYCQSKLYKHHTDCETAVGTCVDCGAMDVEFDYGNHIPGEIVGHDAWGHWSVCPCGSRVYSNHQHACEMPGTCSVCHVTGLEILFIPSNNKQMKYDAEYCWEQCSQCEYQRFKEKHRAFCISPQSCTSCRQTNVNKVVFHVGDYEYVDEDTHKANCEFCGEITGLPHSYLFGTCSFCGAEEPVSAYVPGDPTGDGAVDIFDALAILQCAVGGDISINTANADVNDDGNADIHDALLILQYLAGWNVNLR